MFQHPTFHLFLLIHNILYKIYFKTILEREKEIATKGNVLITSLCEHKQRNEKQNCPKKKKKKKGKNLRNLFRVSKRV